MAISVHRVNPRGKILSPGDVTCAIIMIVGSDTEKATNIRYTYVWEVSGRLGLKKRKAYILRTDFCASSLRAASLLESNRRMHRTCRVWWDGQYWLPYLIECSRTSTTGSRQQTPPRTNPKRTSRYQKEYLTTTTTTTTTTSFGKEHKKGPGHQTMRADWVIVS